MSTVVDIANLTGSTQQRDYVDELASEAVIEEEGLQHWLCRPASEDESRYRANARSSWGSGGLAWSGAWQRTLKGIQDQDQTRAISASYYGILWMA